MKAFIATIAFISSLTVMSAETSATGPLKVSTDKNNVVVKFQGPAAQLLFSKMENAKEESIQKGSLTKTVRVGRDVTCETQAAFIVTYSCTMKIDDSGAVIK